jgi:hypothetical protein
MSASLADRRLGAAMPDIQYEVGAALTELIVGYVPLVAAPNGQVAGALTLAFC